MNKLKGFLKTASIFFLGNAFTKLISFFLLPLYTNKIDPSEFGEYNLVISILNIIVPIVFISIWDSVFRYSFNFKTKEEKYNLFNKGYFIMLIGIVILVVITIITYPLLHYNFPILVCLYAILTGLQYFYTVIARSLKDNTLFVISGCAHSLLSILINILLITVFDMGIESFYISFILGALLQIGIIEFRKKFILQFTFKNCTKNIKEYIYFSIPVTVSAISNWFLTGFTQLFISYWLGTYYNGLYGVANKFSSILVLGIGVFQFAWNELAYELSQDGDRNEYYKKSITEILRFMLILISLLIIAVKIVYPYMVDKQYYESLNIIPILLIGTMANCYASFLGTLYLAEKKSLQLLITTILAGLINIAFSFILIPKFGFIGAISALSIAFVSFSLIRLIAIKIQLNVAPYLNGLVPIIILIPSVILFYKINGTIYLILTLLILTLISVIYILIVYRNLIKSFFIKLRNKKTV